MSKKKHSTLFPCRRVFETEQRRALNVKELLILSPLDSNSFPSLVAMEALLQQHGVHEAIVAAVVAKMPEEKLFLACLRSDS